MNDDDDKATDVNDSLSLSPVEQQTVASRKSGTIWEILRKADQAALERFIEINPDNIHARGFVGECPIHMLFLYGSDAHLSMAKYLIRKFPSIIMQIYDSTLYYGETVLHISIIKKHSEMVQWLLGDENNRAYREHQLQARATGSFFSTGQSQYYGETPLGFACCTNQWRVAKILLKYGASMDVVDTNGNTILHLLVIHNRPKIYSKFKYRWIESAESIDTDDDSTASEINKKTIPIWKRLNNDGLTPYTLAAKLGNWEMFSFLVEEHKIIQWSYGSISCILYPLDQLDCEIKSEIKKKPAVSAFELILQNSDVKLINHPLLVKLLNMKWKYWAGRIILQRFMVALAYLTIFLLTTIFDQKRTETAEGNDVEMVVTNVEDPGGIYKIALNIGRFIVLIGALWKSRVEVKEMAKMGIRSYLQTTGSIFLENCMACAWCLTIISAYIFRLFGMPIETPVLAIASIIGWGYMFFFLIPFQLTGPFVVMIYKMLTTDVLRFCIIYAVFLIGFSQAFLILFDYKGFDGFVLSVKQCFFTMLGDIDVDNYTKTKYHYVSVSLLVLYIFTVTILLLNLLIAMMGNTYQTVIANATEIWNLHRARIIHNIESEMSAEVLCQQAHKYWVNIDGERYLQMEEVDNSAFDADDDDDDHDVQDENTKDIEEDKMTKDTPI